MTAASQLAALSLLLLAILSACGGGATNAPATVPRQPPTAPPTVAGETDPAITVANVIVACREKDGDRLRSLVATEVGDGDLAGLFALGSDVQLLAQTIGEQVDGRAPVTVRLRIRRNGEVDEVERTWQLERGAGGGWRLTALPDCY